MTDITSPDAPDTGADPSVDADPVAPRAGRRLPLWPVGLLVVTAIALAAAFGAARWYVDRATRSDAPDIQDVLDESSSAPLVANPEARAEVGSSAPNVRGRGNSFAARNITESLPRLSSRWCIPSNEPRASPSGPS